MTTSTEEPRAHTEILHQLAKLRLLLAEEFEALRVLDSQKIDELCAEKLSLMDTLKSASLSTASAQDEELLSELLLVRRSVLENQLLLIHARDLSTGMVSRLTTPRGQAGGDAPRLLSVKG